MKHLAAVVVTAFVLISASPVHAWGSAVDRPSVLTVLYMLSIARHSDRRRTNINTATAAELQESLSGIDARIANDIVATRERTGRFDSLLDLLEVPGIERRHIVANHQRMILSAGTSKRHRVPAPVDRSPKVATLAAGGDARVR